MPARLRRLARVVCADLEEIGEAGAIAIARQFWDIQKGLIARAVGRALYTSGADRIITAGIGAEIFAEELHGTTLRRDLGDLVDALPAYAVREVALRNGGP